MSQTPAAVSAVFFDLDGTLIDTEALCNATGTAALANLGHEVPLSFFESLAGIHDAERAVRIAAFTGAALDRVAFYAEWDRLTSERMATGIPLKPGAVELLTALKGRHPLALVTSSRRGPAHEKLQLAGLIQFFDRVITVDDVAAAKPAPDPYLTAAKALDVTAASCVVFEDSEPGAKSAKAAGCFVVQVPDIHGTDGAHADVVAPSLIEGARLAGLL